MKTLASAIRFGTILLVQDVETIDPILNPILNKELQRTGGRTLIRLGAEDIDYSPKFAIILTTRNPAAKLTPDLCSRVTLVNFTVTPASLGNQALSMLLRSERPEMEGKRSDLLKLQGEQNVKLRGLEDRLLEKISGVEGSILDDDSIIKGMEEIKTEAASVSEAIADGEIVMKEVEFAIEMYAGLAGIISKLYFVIESLKSVNHLYQYSLVFFMGILESVPENNAIAESSTPGTSSVAHNARLDLLKNKLFHEVVARVARGLFDEDKLVFSLRLAILAEGSGFDLQKEALTPEGLLESGKAHVVQTFGKDFLWQGRGLNSLKEVCESEIKANTPVLLCSAPGYDVSGRVEVLASESDHSLKSLAMGSFEGYAAAEKLIASSSKEGTWAMLKNIHLCPEDWLISLEKKLYSMSMQFHSEFRLFLTCEMAEDSKLPIPITLVLKSDVCVAEAPSGLKANMLRFFGSIPPERFAKKPIERGRLYLLTAWLHAVIQERLRYSPTGWSKKYEFSEADALNALDVVDTWIEKVTPGCKKQHIAPESLPWEALRTILSSSVFGGRIDNIYDQQVLGSFVDRLFVPTAYDVDYSLVTTEKGRELTLPEGKTREDFCSWIDTLPDKSSPTWLGLAGTAEKSRLKLGGERVFGKVMRIGAEAAASAVGVRGSPRKGSSSPQRGRLSRSTSVLDKLGAILETVAAWGKAIPEFVEGEDLEWMNETSEMDSLQRCISREITLALDFVQQINSDLEEVGAYCQGKVKLTNGIKVLVEAVGVGVVPKKWAGFYETGISTSELWVGDFVARVTQLVGFREGKGLEAKTYNIGGLFNPGSFITASRQFVAQSSALSIDELFLSLDSNSNSNSKDEKKDGANGFTVSGLTIEGAGLGVAGGGARGELYVSDDTSQKLETSTLSWAQQKEKGQGPASNSSKKISLPIYLNNKNRKKVIVAVDVECPNSVEGEFWMQRGVALFFT